MRKLALVAVLVLGSLAVLFPTSAHAQGVGARCKSNTAICIGDKNNDVYIGGNLYAQSPDGGSIILRPGSMTDSTTHALVKTAVLDAGVALINGQLQVLGTTAAAGITATTVQGTGQIGTTAGLDAGYAMINGQLGVLGASVLTGAVTMASTASNTTCTLNAASPSVCTATVTAGSKCQCTNVGASAAIAALGCAVGLSGTTLTVTSANAANHVVNIHCF